MDKNIAILATAGEKQRKFKKKSQLEMIWIRYRKNKLALFGLVVFLLIVIVSISTPLFIDYKTQVIKQNIMDKFQTSSAAHLLGTDQFGRDILCRLLWGARYSILCGLGVMALSLSVGAVLGASAGYFGGIYDQIIMRVLDVFFAIPMTLMAISIVAAFGNSIPNLIVAISLGQIPKMTRIIRSSVITLKDQDFIEAARACDTKKSRIIFKHILPNAMGTLIVEGTLTMGKSIILIAGLSFIGMGIQPPAPEWGAMLSEAKTRLIDYPYLIVAPGIAIILTVMSLTMAGDGLRDALDPKMRH